MYLLRFRKKLEGDKNIPQVVNAVSKSSFNVLILLHMNISRIASNEEFQKSPAQVGFNIWLKSTNLPTTKDLDSKVLFIYYVIWSPFSTRAKSTAFKKRSFFHTIWLAVENLLRNRVERWASFWLHFESSNTLNLQGQRFLCELKTALSPTFFIITFQNIQYLI